MKFPVSESELSELFSFLDKKNKIAIAVSGGRDSTALLLMLSEWLRFKKNLNDIKVYVLTVDHGLRAESSLECEKVKALSVQHGLDHHTLIWHKTSVLGTSQLKARNARYKLLIDFATKKGIDNIITAHTLDDQIETFIMRLGKGSGLDGLRSIEFKRSIDNIDIFRPLLGISRKRITEILEQSGQNWIDDPSNQNKKFERIKIRKNISLLDNLNLSPSMISNSIRRLTRSQNAIKELSKVAFEQTVIVNELGYLSVNRKKIEKYPEDIVMRVLEQSIKLINGGDHISMSSLESAYHEVFIKKNNRTINGCLIKIGKNEYFISRENRNIEDGIISNGEKVIWDSRFIMNLSDCSYEEVIIRSLGSSDDLSNICMDTNYEKIPSFILNVLPGGFIEDKLVLLPNIHNIYNKSNLFVKFIK
tara:strand:+ start:1380 stop:2636 length:1257 start_codon:yes stop_codon:yes gene_type:complete